MNLKPAVSIIVPVYNVKAYLAECLDSILGQDFTDFELLLVDDGSTDGSGVVCDRYAAADSRVQVLHKPNAGVSSARNEGLDHARGTWIMFVDADDLLSPDALSSMMANAAGNDADIIQLGIKTFAGSFKGSSPAPVSQKMVSAGDYINGLMQYSIPGGPVAKLYRRAAIDNHHLRFDTGLKIGEDVIFNLHFVFYTRCNIHISSKVVYHYRQNLKSAVHKRDNAPSYIKFNNAMQAFWAAHPGVITPAQLVTFTAMALYFSLIGSGRYPAPIIFKQIAMARGQAGATVHHDFDTYLRLTAKGRLISNMYLAKCYARAKLYRLKKRLF